MQHHYRTEPYLQQCETLVTGHSPEGGIVLERSIFFPTGGGQPGDSGQLIWEGGRIPVGTTTRTGDGNVVLVPGLPQALPAVGTRVVQRLDWGRRYRHMRMHTALHLLAAVVARPVTGGQIGAAKSRLDFDIPDPLPDVQRLTAQLNLLIDTDLKVTTGWITEEELEARPELIRTLSVRPPQGHGRLRLVGIGEGPAQIDLQPCSGTHVARIGEVGRLTVGEIVNKGRNNRRITIRLDD
ncbi:alanyl-tRNA editing protein [Pseudomonas sp. GX19020]|uniref:alanyl-tRNA editing protein n=1 Tax=Pseudomonas sp. GX19020 TaxID=2942277 RepID=UPI00201A0624|nr:alanyl-tRNA editing protein [Pseudomonas sp. GX19020]MCL4065541.1 alanyl-tRNA editing protein [Pseudomonas sp. GX19020]